MARRIGWAALCMMALGMMAGGATAARAQGVKPVLVIGVSGLNELMGDVRAITEAAGMADAGNMVSGLAGIYTEGLDKSKPWGAYVVLENDEPRVIGFLPVKNLKGLLGMFREQIGAPRDVGDGILQIAADKPQPLYIKEQNGWAFVAQSSAFLGAVPADPTTILGDLVGKYDLAVRVNVQNIPAPLKQLAVAEMKKGFERSLKNVGPEERELTEKLGGNSMQRMVQMVEESEQLTLGFAIDGASRRTYLEGSLTAQPGTDLAKQMADLNNLTSAHTGFLHAGAAATLNFAGTIAPADVQNVVAMLKTAREKAMRGIDDDAGIPDQQSRAAVKDVAGTLIDVLQKTVEAGKIDGGAVLVAGEDELTFAAGGLMADGLKVEESLKKLVKIAEKKSDDVPEFEFNYETYKGVNLHAVTVPVDDDEAQKIFGEELEVVIGTAANAVYIAFGDKPEALLKMVLDKSSASKAVPVPPSQFSLAIGPILKFAASVDDDPKVKAVAALVEVAEGKDHILVTAKPIDRGVAYRLEIEEGILKIIGAAARAQQQGGF